MLARKAARSISARAVPGRCRRGHADRVGLAGLLVRSAGAAAGRRSSGGQLGQLRAAGSGPGCRPRRRPAPRRPAGRASAGRPAGGQQGRAEPAEDVARPGLAGPGRAGQRDPDHGPVRAGHQLAGALEQHGRPGLLDPGPDRADRVVGHPAALLAEQPGQLAGVRGEQPVGRAAAPAGTAARRRRPRSAARTSRRAGQHLGAVGPVAPAGPEQVGLHPARREDHVRAAALPMISAGRSAPRKRTMPAPP